MQASRDLASLLKSSFASREPLRSSTDALRLVNGRGDGLTGLILEQYDRHFTAQVFDADVLDGIDEIAKLVQKEFKVRYFICKDRTQSSAASPEAIKTKVLIDDGSGSKTVVQEFGIRFNVDLNDGLNSGLFLDMRQNRLSVGELSTGSRVLNCFAYTCSFGVHARKGGAAGVVNVDVSKKTLERGAANYALNGLSPSEGEFIKADAAAYLERAVVRNNRFDVIILDPPSFARSEKGTFQVKRDLPLLIGNAVKVLNPGGTICVTTNFNGIADTDLIGMLKKSAQGRTLKNMERVAQDKDFPGTNTFKESYLAGIRVQL